jgi:hypothetical protein
MTIPQVNLRPRPLCGAVPLASQKRHTGPITACEAAGQSHSACFPGLLENVGRNDRGFGNVNKTPISWLCPNKR